MPEPKYNKLIDNPSQLEALIRGFVGSEGFRADLVHAMVSVFGSEDGLAMIRERGNNIFHDLVRAISGKEVDRTARMILVQGMSPEARVQASKAQLEDLERVAEDVERRERVGRQLSDALIDLAFAYGKLYLPG